MCRVYKDNESGVSNEKEKSRVYELEHKMRRLLENREEDWRLKSMEIWLGKGVEYTHFFHQLVNHWKKKNTIW